MDMLDAHFIAAVLGATVGMALGLTGAGGGVLALPALMLGLGFSFSEARQVAFMAVGAAALLGALEGMRQGLVRYKAALLMAAAGSLISPLSLQLAQALPATVMTTGFCLLMLYLAQRMARQALKDRKNRRGPQETCVPCSMSPATGRLRWSVACARSLGLVGAAAGACSGMFGVGGGFLIVPGLKRVSDVSMHGIVATSLAVIALISTSGVVAAYANGTHVSRLGLLFILGAVIGLMSGRRLAPAISGARLQLGFAAAQALLAVGLLIHMLQGR